MPGIRRDAKGGASEIPWPSVTLGPSARRRQAPAARPGKGRPESGRSLAGGSPPAGTGSMKERRDQKLMTTAVGAGAGRKE